jgi:hypothetical protein
MTFRIRGGGGEREGEGGLVRGIWLFSRKQRERKTKFVSQILTAKVKQKKKTDKTLKKNKYIITKL